MSFIFQSYVHKLLELLFPDVVGDPGPYQQLLESETIFFEYDREEWHRGHTLVLLCLSGECLSMYRSRS